jgi:glutaconate CoA-transferase subunit B
MEPDPVSKEMTVATIHPGISREQLQAATGWPLKYAANVGETPAPTAEELRVLREIQARTKRAHEGA